MNLQEVRDVFQIIYYIALSITGPLALVSYLQTKKKEQQQREEGTYDSLDDKHQQYQRLCLERPDLDIFDYAHPNPPPPTETDRRRELSAFTILISILERAFLIYRGHSAAVRKTQWEGRVQYIDAFLRRDNFRRAWENCGEMFDTDFRQFVDSRLAQARPRGNSPNPRKSTSNSA